MTDAATYCQWEADYPTRETAEHAARVHERTHEHHTALERVE
ncbi:MAG: hypothetical protein ABEH77_02590 [Halobacteriaceae archaeon]